MGVLLGVCSRQSILTLTLAVVRQRRVGDGSLEANVVVVGWILRAIWKGDDQPLALLGYGRVPCRAVLYRPLVGIGGGGSIWGALGAADVPHLLSGPAPQVARAEVVGGLEELVGGAVLGLHDARLGVGDGGPAR